MIPGDENASLIDAQRLEHLSDRTFIKNAIFRQDSALEAMNADHATADQLIGDGVIPRAFMMLRDSSFASQFALAADSFALFDIGEAFWIPAVKVPREVAAADPLLVLLAKIGALT